MPRRPIKAKAGFLTPVQIAGIAKSRGFDAKARTISAYASRGKIPFGQPVPGMKEGIMFPESRLKAVLESMPKKAILPEGSITKDALVKKARGAGLAFGTVDIDTHLKRMLAGKERPPKGLASDLFDSHHRLILPEAFAKRLIGEAKARKNLPRLIEAGKVLSLSQVATGLGLASRSLHERHKEIKSFRVGTGRYVTAKEAARFKAGYVPKSAEKKPAKLQAAKPGKARAVKQAAKTRAKPAEKRVLSAEDLMWKWFNERAHEMSGGRRELIERVINQSKGVSLEEYQKKVLPLLEKLFYR